MKGKPISLKQLLGTMAKAYQNKQIRGISQNIQHINDVPQQYLQATHIFLSHNFINDTTGLIQFQHCTTLSLASNNINSLQDIENLELMTSLKHLRLDNNPVAFFPTYREYTINTIPNLLSLDGSRISEQERIQSKVVYTVERQQFRYLCAVRQDILLLKQQLVANDGTMEPVNPYGSVEQLVYQEIMDQQYHRGRGKTWEQIYEQLLNQYSTDYERLKNGDTVVSSFHDIPKPMGFDSVVATAAAHHARSGQIQPGTGAMSISPGQTPGAIRDARARMHKAIAAVSTATVSQHDVQKSLALHDMPPVVVPYGPQGGAQEGTDSHVQYSPIAGEAAAMNSQIMSRSRAEYIQQVSQRGSVLGEQREVTLPRQDASGSQHGASTARGDANMRSGCVAQRPTLATHHDISTPWNGSGGPRADGQASMADKHLSMGGSVQHNPVDVGCYDQTAAAAEGAPEAAVQPTAAEVAPGPGAGLIQLQQENQELREQLQRHTRSNEEMRRKVCALEREGGELRAAVGSGQKLQQDNTLLNQQLQQSNSERERLREEVQSLRAKVAEAEAVQQQNRDADKQLKQYKEQHHAMKMELEKIQVQYNKQSVQIKYQQELQQGKLDEIKKLNSEKLSVQNDIQVLMKEVIRYRNQQKAVDVLERLMLRKILKRFYHNAKALRVENYACRRVESMEKGRMVIRYYRFLLQAYSVRQLGRRFTVADDQRVLHQYFGLLRTRYAYQAKVRKNSYQDNCVADKLYTKILLRKTVHVVRQVGRQCLGNALRVRGLAQRRYRAQKRVAFTAIQQQLKAVYANATTVTHRVDERDQRQVLQALRNRRHQLACVRTAVIQANALHKQKQLIRLLSQHIGIQRLQLRRDNKRAATCLAAMVGRHQWARQCDVVVAQARGNLKYILQFKVFNYLRSCAYRKVHCSKVDRACQLTYDSQLLHRAFIKLHNQYLSRVNKNMHNILSESNVLQLREQLTDLQQRGCIIETEFQTNFQQKQALQKKYTQLKQELIKQLHKNKECKRQLDRLLSMGATAPADIGPQRDEQQMLILINQYQIQNQTLLAQLNKKKAKIQEYKKLLENNEQLKIQRQQIELNEVEGQFLLYQEQIQQLKKYNSQQQQLIEQKDSQIRALQEQYSRLEIEAQESRAEWVQKRMEFDNEVTDLQVKYSGLLKEVEVLRENNMRLQEQNAQLSKLDAEKVMQQAYSLEQSRQLIINSKQIQQLEKKKGMFVKIE